MLGDIMAHVVVRVGDNLLESVITRRSADELKLKKGDKVAAVVKATEVMILKEKEPVVAEKIYDFAPVRKIRVDLDARKWKPLP